jgi:methyltransferase-like protein
MKLPQIVTEKIIKKLFAGEDYRQEVLAMIDSVFLQHVIDFFKQIVETKMNDKALTDDWYKTYFLDANLGKETLSVNAGVNLKSITNAYGKANKETVLQVSLAHYRELKDIIEQLIENGEGLDVTLTIKFRSVSIELSLSETLIVVNSLAVKRAQIRGGAWSTVGKQTELPFMVCLAKLYSVPSKALSLKRANFTKS